MMARLLGRLRLAARSAATRESTRAARSRRVSARGALAWGVAAFAAFTVAVATAVDTFKSEWRDPEFAFRQKRLEKWKRESPDRPLVIAFGSSRTQMGLSPAAMSFPDEPGSPVVFNFGYRAGHPLGAWLQCMRVLDSGVKPDAILVQLADVELMVRGLAERQLRRWSPRFSRGDIARLAPYTIDDSTFRRTWFAGRLTPLSTYREAILSDLLPAFQSWAQALSHEWEMMDEYGFSPHVCESLPEGVRMAGLKEVKKKYALKFSSFKASEETEWVFRNLMARCKKAGIPVAFFWAPVSPTYRSWLSADSLAALEEFEHKLAANYGVPVFPAPRDLAETDFADGFHLLRHGAARYSRWLAVNHLKPWLTSIGLAR